MALRSCPNNGMHWKDANLFTRAWFVGFTVIWPEAHSYIITRPLPSCAAQSCAGPTNEYIMSSGWVWSNLRYPTGSYLWSNPINRKRHLKLWILTCWYFPPQILSRLHTIDLLWVLDPKCLQCEDDKHRWLFTQFDVLPLCLRRCISRRRRRQ